MLWTVLFIVFFFWWVKGYSEKYDPGINRRIRKILFGTPHHKKVRIGKYRRKGLPSDRYLCRKIKETEWSTADLNNKVSISAIETWLSKGIPLSANARRRYRKRVLLEYKRARQSPDAWTYKHRLRKILKALNI